ncbi:MAG: hypothetical protein KDK66_00440 [Deltaproteobacteria bacterium]|nr:hypothetical protein [Deltaproteobacteria bacterium]
MKIRITSVQDYEEIQKIHFSAFPENERELIVNLVIDLFAKKTMPPTLSFWVASLHAQGL